MELNLTPPSPNRISTSPAGRGWRARPEVVVNADYVRTLLEENRLTERDEALLRWLNELPVMSARQAKLLFWPDTTSSNMHRRLRALYDYHLLDRVRMVSKSDGITYTLGKAGRLWLGEIQRGGSPPRVNVRQIAHDLAVSEVATQFVLNLRRLDPTHKKFQFNWQGEAGARIIHRDKILVEPDARARLTLNETMQYQLFLIELDMNTERAAAFDAKIKRYHTAYQQRTLKDASGNVPTLMVVAPTPERVQLLTQLIAAGNSPLTWVLNPLPILVEHGIYGPDWTTISNGQIKSELLALVAVHNSRRDRGSVPDDQSL